MREPVSAIMTPYMARLGLDDTIEQVAAVMNSHSLSFAPIGDSKGNIFGIITAQEVEHFRSAKRNPKTVMAWELCIYKPLQVDPNLSIVEVAKLMVQNNVHYIVVTEDQAIKGIISSLDILKQYLLKENA